MKSETIDPKSIRANTPDWQEGYQQGLNAGYAKSITIVRHLQKVCEYPSLAWGRLEKAMELISKKMK